MAVLASSKIRTSATAYIPPGSTPCFLGTLGAFPAVISGLVLTKWDIAGTGATLFHHYFVWPSFALLIALSVWRLIVGTNTSRGIFYIYLAIMILTAALVSIAGFWGGEMLLSK
ncbi:MAG: hypothetical protein WB586_11085 [Chthoniobacterales bacterium]